MSKRLLVTLAAVLLVLAGGGGSGAQQERGSRAQAIAHALQNYLHATAAERATEELPTKAVPRTDKAETTVIGAVSFVDSTDFLDDGTPFRIVATHTSRPFGQDVFLVCLGSSFNSSCGRLALGRRASFTSDVLVIEDGDSAGLALFVVKRLQT